MRPVPNRRFVGLVAVSAAVGVAAAACTSRIRTPAAGVARTIRPDVLSDPVSGPAAAGRGTPSASSVPAGSSTGSSARDGAASGSAAEWSGPDWVRWENSRPGSPGWAFPSARTAGPTELAGWASRTSVASGQPVTLFVTAATAWFTVDALRLGWYGGVGARARVVLRPAPRPPAATPDHRRMRHRAL